MKVEKNTEKVFQIFRSLFQREGALNILSKGGIRKKAKLFERNKTIQIGYERKPFYSFCHYLVTAFINSLQAVTRKKTNQGI